MSKKGAAFLFDLNATGAGTVEQSSRRTERGDLVALSVTLPKLVAQKGDFYVRAFLAISGTTKTESQIELIGDYVYEGHTPSFHGRIPLVEDTSIVVQVWTSIADQLRINGTIEDEA